MMNPAYGGVAGALTNFFASPDYKSAYDQYAHTLTNNANAYNPSIRFGKMAQGGQGALNIYHLLNPDVAQNRVASDFQYSPYEQQIMDNSMRMMNENGANTGMMGSTSQQSRMLQDLASEQEGFENQYINRGLNQYNSSQAYLNNLLNSAASRGYHSLGDKQNLLNQAALATLQGNVLPSKWQNALMGGVGGFMGEMM